MQMNDAHIYCTKDSFKEEFLAVCNMYLYYFKIFGIEKYEMRLSLHDPKKLGEKYVVSCWNKILYRLILFQQLKQILIIIL